MACFQKKILLHIVFGWRNLNYNGAKVHNVRVISAQSNNGDTFIFSRAIVACIGRLLSHSTDNIFESIIIQKTQPLSCPNTVTKENQPETCAEFVISIIGVYFESTKGEFDRFPSFSFSRPLCYVMDRTRLHREKMREQKK